MEIIGTSLINNVSLIKYEPKNGIHVFLIKKNEDEIINIKENQYNAFEWDWRNDFLDKDIITLYMGDKLIISAETFDDYFHFIQNPLHYIPEGIKVEVDSFSLKKFLRKKITKAQHCWFYVSKNENYVKLNLWYREQKRLQELSISELLDELIKKRHLLELKEGE